MKKTLRYNINYVDFKKFKENFFSKIEKKCNIFFAFGKDRFEEQLKEKGLKAEEVGSIGYGGYIPANRVTQYAKLMNQLDSLDDSYFQSLHSNKHHIKYLKDAVKYELGNHEYGYTRDNGTLNMVYKMLHFHKYRKNNAIFFEAVKEYIDWDNIRN